MQKVVSPSKLRGNTMDLAAGRELDPEVFVEWLDEQDYTFCAKVQAPGQAAVRGGIIDAWPLTEELPVRVDFEGSMIDTIRQFEPTDQRTAVRLSGVSLPPQGDTAGPEKQTVPFFDYVPADSTFIWSTAESVKEHAGLYENNVRQAKKEDSIVTLEDIQVMLKGRHTRRIAVMELAEKPVLPDIFAVGDLFHIPQSAVHPDAMEALRQNLLSQLQAAAASGNDVAVFLNTKGSLHHFREAMKPAQPDNIQLLPGTLSEGLASRHLKFVIVAESDIYGKKEAIGRRYLPRTRKTPVHRARQAALTDLSDISPGDLVVHSAHGIGRYLGLNEITIKNRTHEMLSIEYDEGAVLHVPVTQAHLITRYVGFSGQHTRLHKLGGRRWSKEKSQARENIIDFASELLEVQAKRSALEGHAFSSDTTWQHDFDNSFPFRETEDQQRVIGEIKQDMESTRPMDRLLCGDAGYGKTEVAMRAAFKAALDGKQTAVLVPTTVLAQQHYNTFTERMSAFPLRIQMISRFKTRSEQDTVIKDLAAGRIDIVIGTHALLQEGVSFRDLGLVIIDEEQRFGVNHKEKLKRVRELVDVLTMTATPIPRTLYMSMTGVRDMSLIQTAPRERMPVETVITEYDDNIVRDAILREISRDGQVFFLHNRVKTIAGIQKRLQRLIPEADIRTAHGQMPSSGLEAVMRSFVSGEFNVLLCTTIIESGMDIPRANTIIIDRADRFGIADLYQLRGRVGRSTHKAYAYLLIPPRGTIDSAARKRLSAIERHGGLGGSFHLAIQDLEIRGAGNILGAKQSGYIRAIGFGLYFQLMKRSVMQLKGQPVPPVIDVEVRLDFVELSLSSDERTASAFVPYDYVKEEKLRLEIYRKLAELSTLDDLAGTRSEMEDRFGRIPPALNRLFKIAELKIA
ncbi:MAG: transcription-repair coupling factor, partial [Verrucomicrobiota bacterium]